LKHILNIYTNGKANFFLREFLSEYNLYFLGLDQVDISKENTRPGVIILNNYEDFNIIKSKKLNDNNLILCSLKNINFNKKNIIITPKSITHIRTRIENFLASLKFFFHDISIVDEKLTNVKNNSFCYLTKVEVDILSFLIAEKVTTKKYIKENILNIKNSIQTNSLDSHLTRIRKKMNEVNTSVKIQSKNENLIITT